MESSAILMLGTLLFTGFVAGRVVSKFGLPEVTGYILAGILLNPEVSGIIPVSFIENSSLIDRQASAIHLFLFGTDFHGSLVNSNNCTKIFCG